MSHQQHQVALVGNPNVGKSSVFNLLTGLRQKVGNFPGVTVDKKTGFIRLPKSGEAEVTDLPGLYSLYPTSEDERVVLSVLLDNASVKYPDVIGYIADANDLERNLLLFTQIRDLGFPVVLGINMIDMAAEDGLRIDTAELSSRLSVPVVPLNGRNGEGIPQFIEAIDHQLGKSQPEPFYDLSAAEKQIAEDIMQMTGLSSGYQALLLAHQAQYLPQLSSDHKFYIQSLRKQYGFDTHSLQLDEMMSRYKRIAPIVNVCSHRESKGVSPLTRKLDKVLTHPFFGLLIFFVLMLLVFQSIFTWSEKPMEWVEIGFAGLGTFLGNVLPEGVFSNLVTEGIIAGLGGVVVFVPQIAILFFLISLLEESGYMARVVYLLDSVMRRFGLNGRSVVALISGGACAIPAVMATRTITNWKERLITIMVTPLISCSARIPVFTILIAIAVPPVKLGGWLSLQALVFMGLYVLGALVALLSAWVFHKILKTDEQSFLLMELPRYQVPHWRNVFLTVFEKIRTFTFEAGKVIIIVSILLWFLASYGPEKAMKRAEERAYAEYALSQEIPVEQLITTHQLEASYAGLVGKTIEPLIRPLGYDWKIGIALISSFAAREVFVGTMATLYAVEDEEDEKLLRERMQEAVFSDTGKQVFTIATAISLMIFYLFAMQCMSTVAIVRRETKSWKWPLIQIGYMTLLAYSGSFIAYQLLSHLS